MKYGLLSRTLAANGSTELIFVQTLTDFDPRFPVKIAIEALVCPEYFQREEDRDEYDFAFESREIESLDGRPLEEIFGDAKEVKITFGYAFRTDDEPVLLPRDDETLDSEIIE